MKYLKIFEDFNEFDDDGEDEEIEPHSEEIIEYINGEKNACKQSLEEFGVFNLIGSDGNKIEASIIYADNHGKPGNIQYEFGFYDIKLLKDEFDEHFQTSDHVFDYLNCNYFTQIYVEGTENSNDLYFVDKDSYNKLRLYLVEKGNYDLIKVLNPDVLIKK